MAFACIGIEHVQLAAPKGCEAEARRFFGELLGMTEVPKPENLRHRGGVWFQCGFQQIHIGVEEDFKPAQKAHPGFLVHNVRGLRDHLAANGVKVKDDDLVEGVIRFHAEDPFGNRLEFMERLHG
jgi:catechol 2,3-dioxygenase-like lactoylglutathione lyase family enzyme